MSAKSHVEADDPKSREFKVRRYFEDIVRRKTANKNFGSFPHPSEGKSNFKIGCHTFGDNWTLSRGAL